MLVGTNNLTERIEKVRAFIKAKGFVGMQTFDTRNVVGDPMETIYEADGITIDYCEGYYYLEIFGLSDEEYRSLSDILDVCGYSLLDGI
jgi:hypothetical protein